MDSGSVLPGRRRVEGDLDSMLTHYSAGGKSLSRHLESWARRHVRCEGGVLYMGKSRSMLQAYCIM
jgi:hypothetical protein